MNNIRIVDDIVRETELLMSEFYGDQETSYVFTADHGMSKIGNHGDGGIGFPLVPTPCVLTSLFRSRQYPYPTRCLGRWHSRPHLEHRIPSDTGRLRRAMGTLPHCTA